MTREEKAQKIDELAEKFSQNTHFYITDASGLTVAQINAFRREFVSNQVLSMGFIKIPSSVKP